VTFFKKNGDFGQTFSPKIKIEILGEIQNLIKIAILVKSEFLSKSIEKLDKIEISVIHRGYVIAMVARIILFF